jgi:protoporphyrinogen oxidase
MSFEHLSVVCIGAGPAGLTAAYLLTKQGAQVTVLETNPTLVGGISRTETYKGFSIDIGGHRFFSKSPEIEALWTEILGDQLLERPRKSRIFFGHTFFDYPLRPADAFRKLGVIETARCMLSYLRARMHPVKTPLNFEQWVTNRFGRRLFEIFFLTYTEKVWGMRCTEISADWAAQRIQGLSLVQVISHALMPGRRRAGAVVKTLIDHFRYPRRGPGMMWAAAADKVAAQGGRVLLDRQVVSVAWDAAGRRWHVTARERDGSEHRFDCDHVISTMPIREIVPALLPPAPAAAATAASQLRYRDFLIVALIVRDRKLFDDNWIYIHDPRFKVGRIQNFKSWSVEMVPDPALNCYGMEYFCFENDALWTSTDAELLRLATRELIALGLAREDEILDGTVVRQVKAYPVYDQGYQEHVETVREAVRDLYPNLHLVGRNGMHKYNNQDHAMMTGMLAARNILAGRQLFDVWQVNQDAEYHEAGVIGARPLPDRHLPPRAVGGRTVVAPV